MEEKKKRVRPTWAMVRELQTKITDLLLGHTNLEIALKNAREKIDLLEKSNSLMEKELDRLRKELDAQQKNSNKQRRLWQALKNRGFWARVFNMSGENDE